MCGARLARVTSRRSECGSPQRVSGASTNGLLHVSIQTGILIETCQISPWMECFCVTETIPALVRVSSDRFLDGLVTSATPSNRSSEDLVAEGTRGLAIVNRFAGS